MKMNKMTAMFVLALMAGSVGHAYADTASAFGFNKPDSTKVADAATAAKKKGWKKKGMMAPAYGTTAKK